MCLWRERETDSVVVEWEGVRPHLGVGLSQSYERLQLSGVGCHCSSTATYLPHIYNRHTASESDGN